jgi:hypothetical protein
MDLLGVKNAGGVHATHCAASPLLLQYSEKETRQRKSLVFVSVHAASSRPDTAVPARNAIASQSIVGSRPAYRRALRLRSLLLRCRSSLLLRAANLATPDPRDAVVALT